MTTETTAPPADATGEETEFRTPEMNEAIAEIVAWDKHHLFGAGTMSSPLVPVEVPLIGGNGNAFAVIAAVQREVRKYARSVNDDTNFTKKLSDCIAAEMMASGSYQELLVKAMRLVEVC